jgi:hypothetical protein
MANEVKYTYASAVTLEANGASAASNAFVAADDTSLAVANASDYPLADLVLTCDFGAAVGANYTVNLYRQDFDIVGGTEDAPAPATTYKYLFVGAFVIPSGQSASASYPLPNVPISQTCKFSIENGTNQNLSAGWVLKARPKTYAPAA